MEQHQRIISEFRSVRIRCSKENFISLNALICFSFFSLPTLEHPFCHLKVECLFNSFADRKMNAPKNFNGNYVLIYCTDAGNAIHDHTDNAGSVFLLKQKNKEDLTLGIMTVFSSLRNRPFMGVPPFLHSHFQAIRSRRGAKIFHSQFNEIFDGVG